MPLISVPGGCGDRDAPRPAAPSTPMPPAVRPDPIARSHERSAGYGLDALLEPDYGGARQGDMQDALGSARLLMLHALPAMETLHEQIANTSSMVILTDARGLILRSVGDSDFLEQAERVALAPGVTWSEQSKGTNAIGTALAERTPIMVHADQHFLRVNHFLTCSAAPIFDPDGAPLGVLDVTGEHRSRHAHTMALVRMSAQMIENQVFNDAFVGSIRLHFHSRPEFVGTLVEGLAAFSSDGKLLSANRSGQMQLGMGLAQLRMQSFTSLFGLPIGAVVDRYRDADPGRITLEMHNGVRVHARAEVRRRSWVAPGFDPDPPAGPHAEPRGGGRSGAVAEARANADANGPWAGRAPTARPASAGADPSDALTLESLDTGDPQVAAAIARLRKVIGRDIPVMIGGPTGSGKELLARAIHNASRRANGPFVAVNCASIPESLIESELFGYDEGAFTGARRKGGIGKVQQAHDGTLFLDEIGDMPLDLQARLLRVLQERVVNPLGSGRQIPVDVTIICASNRNLKEQAARGAFREDLYYRLNGLVVRLPALRERTDLDVVARRILARTPGGEAASIGRDAMDIFRLHPWPGNLRQLANVLRTALAMTEDGTIRREDLPDDFLEDVLPTDAAARPAPMIGETTVECGRDPLAAGSGLCATPAIVAAVPPAPSALEAADASSGGAGSATLQDVELATIVRAVDACAGNVSEAARRLGISRNTIYRKLASRA